MKRYLSWHAVAALVVAALVVAALQGTSAAAPPGSQAAAGGARRVPALPPQGLYEYCQPGTGSAALSACEARLKTMRDAGFAVVVNYGDLYGSMANLLAYGQYAQSIGLKMIWDLEDPTFWGTDGLTGNAAVTNFPQMAASCTASGADCASNGKFAAWIVSKLKNQPETWMYFTGDEPNLWQSLHHDPGAPQQLKAWYDLIHAADPGHSEFVVSNEGGSGLPCGNGSNILPFIGASDVFGGDYYPIYPAQPCPISGWDTIASTEQGYVSQDHKAGLILSMQAFGDGEPNVGLTGPFPTTAQMLQQRNDILLNSQATAILWYCFFYQRSGAPPRSAKQWNSIKSAAFAPYP